MLVHSKKFNTHAIRELTQSFEMKFGPKLMQISAFVVQVGATIANFTLLAILQRE